MCSKVLPSTSRRLASFSTTQMFEPTTAWMPALGIAQWSFNLGIFGAIGAFKAQPGYQLAAARPDLPGAAVPLGSAVTTNGWTNFQPTIPTLTNHYFMRLGVFYSGGTAGGGADVELQIALATRGSTLGTKTIDVQPYDDVTTDTAITPFTGWFSTMEAGAVKASIITADTAGNLSTQLFGRIAADRAAPQSWVALEGGFTNAPTGNGERVTGSLSFGVANSQWAQLGLGVKRPSGARPRSTVHVAAISIGA